MRYGLRGGGLGVEYDEEGAPIDDLSGTTYHDGTTYNQSGQKMGPPVPFTTDPLSWANANSSMLLWGAGALVGLILLAKVSR